MEDGGNLLEHVAGQERAMVAGKRQLRTLLDQEAAAPASQHWRRDARESSGKAGRGREGDLMVRCVCVW